MNNIKLFEEKKVSSFYDEVNEKWYFSIVDVIEVLTESINPTDYLKKLRKRDTEPGNFLGANCPRLQ